MFIVETADKNTEKNYFDHGHPMSLFSVYTSECPLCVGAGPWVWWTVGAVEGQGHSGAG